MSFRFEKIIKKNENGNKDISFTSDDEAVTASNLKESFDETVPRYYC